MFLQLNTHDQIDDFFSNKTWNLLNRTDKIASHWTTPSTGVFSHLIFFIVMLVSLYPTYTIACCISLFALKTNIACVYLLILLCCHPVSLLYLVVVVIGISFHYASPEWTIYPCI